MVPLWHCRRKCHIFHSSEENLCFLTQVSSLCSFLGFCEQSAFFTATSSPVLRGHCVLHYWSHVKPKSHQCALYLHNRTLIFTGPPASFAQEEWCQGSRKLYVSIMSLERLINFDKRTKLIMMSSLWSFLSLALSLFPYYSFITLLYFHISLSFFDIQIPPNIFLNSRCYQEE